MLPILRDIVEDGNIMRIFVGNHSAAALRIINFGVEPPKNDMMHNQYRIYLEDGFPAKREDLVCILPNHPIKSKRFLESRFFSSRDDFNKELNDRFSKSVECTEQYKEHRLLVLYGSHCYVCKSLTGTVYIVWATRIARINKSNAASVPYEFVPLIMNCNGQNSVKSLYLLRLQIDNKPSDLALLPKVPGNPRFMYNKKYSPFVCETRPDEPNSRHITVISKEDALAMVMQSTKEVSEWLPFERVPFSMIETEEGIVEMNIQSDSFVSWVESPRELFTTQSGLLIKESSGPPQLFRGGVDEPDPFENTVDEEETSRENTGVQIDLDDI